MDSPDCYTILRIFKWIRANLEEHTGYDYLDINDNKIVFIFQKKNTKEYYVKLYANKNTIDDRCEKGTFIITKTNNNTNRRTTRNSTKGILNTNDFSITKLYIALVNPNQNCPGRKNVTPKIYGEKIVLLGILLGCYFNLDSIELQDTARQQNWRGIFLRQLAYKQDCEKNNGMLPKDKPTHCYSYYRQFGFRDNTEKQAPKDCNNKVIQTNLEKIFMTLQLKKNIINNNQVIREILSMCLMEFFQKLTYDDIKIKDVIIDNFVQNKLQPWECEAEVLTDDDLIDSRLFGGYDFYPGSHNILNRKRRSSDVLPFYTTIKSEQISDRNLGWEESKTTNEDMRQSWFYSDKYQGSYPRLGRKSSRS
jgi:hypothetical protein